MLQKQVIVRYDQLFALQPDQDSLKTTVLCQRANAPLKPLLDYFLQSMFSINVNVTFTHAKRCPREVKVANTKWAIHVKHILRKVLVHFHCFGNNEIY